MVAGDRRLLCGGESLSVKCVGVRVRWGRRGAEGRERRQSRLEEGRVGPSSTANGLGTGGAWGPETPAEGPRPGAGRRVALPTPRGFGGWEANLGSFPAHAAFTWLCLLLDASSDGRLTNSRGSPFLAC